MNDDSKIIIYTTEDGLVKIDTTFDSETVWLSIDQMSILFQRDKSTISRHIKNIFEEGELTRDSVVAKFATTAFSLSSFSSNTFLICREIVDLSLWNSSAIWSIDSQTVSWSKVALILVIPSSVVYITMSVCGFAVTRIPPSSVSVYC